MLPLPPLAPTTRLEPAGEEYNNDDELDGCGDETTVGDDWDG